MSGKTDQPKLVGVIGHLHPHHAALTRLLAAGEPALVHFAQSGGQIAEVMMDMERRAQLYGYATVDVVAGPHGARIEYGGRTSGKAFAQRGYDVDMVFIDEAKELTMDETTAPPLVTPTDPAGAPPSRVSNDVNHPDFHPSYLRVGVKLDGVDRNDLKWFDAERGTAITTNGTQLFGTVEPYWRTEENRQQRRARERWERKHGKTR